MGRREPRGLLRGGGRFRLPPGCARLLPLEPGEQPLAREADDTAAADDSVVESHGVKVFVDSRSMPYIEGSEIDYVDNNMLGAGFAIRNPNVKSSCGCGASHQF